MGEGVRNPCPPPLYPRIEKRAFVLCEGRQEFTICKQIVSNQKQSDLPSQIAQLVQRPLSEREVVGSNPGRTIPKV